MLWCERAHFTSMPPHDTMARKSKKRYRRPKVNHTRKQLLAILSGDIAVKARHELCATLQTVKGFLFSPCKNCGVVPTTYVDICCRLFCQECLRSTCPACVLLGNLVCKKCRQSLSVHHWEIPILKDAMDALLYECPDCNARFVSNHESYVEHVACCSARMAFCKICKKDTFDILGHIGGQHASHEVLQRVLCGKGNAECFTKFVQNPDSTLDEFLKGTETYSLVHEEGNISDFEKTLLKRYKIDEGCVVNACPGIQHNGGNHACITCGKFVCGVCFDGLGGRGNCPACRGCGTLCIIPNAILKLLNGLVSKNCPWCQGCITTPSLHFEEHIKSCKNAIVTCGICEEKMHVHDLCAHVGEFHTSFDTLAMLA